MKHQPRPLSDAQRLRRQIRQHAGRLIAQTPSLAPVRSAVVFFCEADAACADLYALCRANPGDHTLRADHLQQQLERRHAYRVLLPYLPQPDPDWIDPEDRDILE